MAETVLAVDNVTRRYANFAAVVDVSFEMTAGERLAIIGPNGAGKTTLLNLIGGQVQPNRGRIRWCGRDITTASPSRRAGAGIGRSFQVPSIFPEVTAGQNVWLGLQRASRHGHSLLRRSHPDEAALSEVLDRWHLSAHRHVLPGALSHGDRRRLELALSLSAKPRLLLLDEPTAGLTVEEGGRLVRDVEALGRDVTVILVDHDMNAVFAMAERIIVMNRGAILADGSPEDIRKDQRVADAYGLEPN